MTTISRPSDVVWGELSKIGQPPEELRFVVEAALERNARSATVLDLRGISDVTSFFVIATGDSDTHTRAISENILDRMRGAGYRPIGVEGLNEARWILMDFVELIVHIFLNEVRGFYQLERLWGDARIFKLK
jgi:ribosome-associated protein|tara:strand:+ start:442 stop:837 length:396 start_codon:yes stop_codon:yes gene_type:complete